MSEPAFNTPDTHLLTSSRTSPGWRAFGPRGTGRGFTLIELLVVMSIISLLVGLAMPGLAWARKRADQAACLSNLRQISIGLTAYLPDNRDNLPYLIPLSQDELDPKERDALLVQLEKYVTNTAVFECPSDRDEVAILYGSSYDYYPGWIMWARELFRGEPRKTVARTVTKFYELTPGKWPIMADAQSWHNLDTGVGRNASYWDGSASPLVDWNDPAWKN